MTIYTLCTIGWTIMCLSILVKSLPSLFNDDYNILFVYYNGKKYKKVKINRKKVQNEILYDKLGLDEFFSPIKDIYMNEKLTKIEK